MAHAMRTAMLITAHVNSAGMVRGGPELEHATDGVLMLTGHPQRSRLRELGSTKNRHGDTTLTTAMEMTAAGFRDVDPGPGFPRRALGVGAALGLVDGKLVEVQALIAATSSTPRKIVTSGVAVERVRVLLDVLARAGCPIAADVTVRTYGDGDPGDAAVYAALWSCAVGRALPPSTCLAGEVGLDGALRGVGDVEVPSGYRLLGHAGARLFDLLGKAHLSCVV